MFNAKKSFKSSNLPICGSIMSARRPLFGLYQAAMGTVAVRMIFRSPAATDGDGLWLFKLQNKRLDIRRGVRAVAKRQILAPCAATVGDAFGDLFYDRGFDEIFVG
jgi:hypothetical protein